MAPAPRHIAIVAMRRSGTTALWRLLQQDDRFTCFDEPFSRLHAQLPADNKKRTRADLIALYKRDPERFRQTYAPIQRGQEFARGLDPAQRDYLRLLTSVGPTVFDTTRCTGKVADLKEVLPDAMMVHLYRHPAAFVTSHLLPSDRNAFLGLRPRYNRWSFFRRKSRFNGWGMEELTRTEHVETTRALLSEVNVSLAPASKPVPAFERLLAIWLGAFRLNEREGRDQFGDRFLSLSFEELCAQPDVTLATIQQLADAPPRALETGWLKPAAAGYQPTNPAWLRAALAVGFDESELARFFPGAGG